MPPVYRLFLSSYSDDDFEWDQAKSLATFEDRNFVFEAARIVFRGRLLRRRDPRHRDEIRYQVLGALFDRVVMIVYTPRGRRCRIISLRMANALETAIYHGDDTD